MTSHNSLPIVIGFVKRPPLEVAALLIIWSLISLSLWSSEKLAKPQFLAEKYSFSGVRLSEGIQKFSFACVTLT